MNKPADELQGLEKAIASNDLYEIQNQFSELSKREDLDIGQLERVAVRAKELRRHEISLHFFDKILSREPENLAALFQAGDTCAELGNFAAAEKLFFRGLKLNEHYAPCLAGLGRVYLMTNLPDKAAEVLEAASNIQKNDANIHINLARSLAILGEYEKALESLETVKAQCTNSSPFFMVQGDIYSELGDMENAQKSFKRGIKVNPNHGIAYVNYSRVKKFKEEDLKEVLQFEKILDQNLTSDVEEPLRFALGKMFDDVKQYDKAFKHYSQANAIAKRPIVDKYSYLVNMRKRLTKPKYQKRLAKHVNPSDMPIFVVGMPRSGTTLMAKLLARHSKIGNAGERMEIPLMEKALMDNYRIRFMDNVRPLNFVDEESLTQKANDYISALTTIGKGKPHVVDKMPGNHMQLAMIHAIFPNAHIIHIKRHPLDTCLSCFFQNFEHLPWANDLKTIAEVYNNYRLIMNYWSKHLPLNHFTEISYEYLLDNQEAELRRLIEFCGLEWEAQCLEENEKDDSAIKTASVWQARQPVYKTSKYRWINYAPFIEGLAKDLSPWLKEDKELLAKNGITI